MENTYGIGVANRYALFLDDESDPLETLSLKEQEKELKKKSKVAEKENNKAKPEPAKAKPINAQKKVINKENAINKVQEIKREDSKPNHQRSNNDGKSERSNKLHNENREERNNRRNREDRPYNGPMENRDREERPRRENFGDNFETRNRDRGERGDRSDRGERGDRVGRALGNKPPGARGGARKTFDDRRGKREFDRQSGSDKTGVKPIDKRDGAGAHNWGSHKDVIEEADTKPANDIDQLWGEGEKTDTTTAAAPEPKGEGEVEGEGGAAVEEEPKELTLDEWKAQRAGRAKPQYNIRKAGEGEDPTQWKKMYELRKKANELHSQESDDEEYDASEYPQRVGRQKHVLDIDIQFNDARRGAAGRGRGQRSGPRGTRPPRGGPGGDAAPAGPPGNTRPERRYRDEQVNVEEKNDNRRAPKVDDERDFPSLG